MLAVLAVFTFVTHASMYCLVLSISCVSRKHTRERVVREGVAEKEVVTVLREISMPSSSLALKGDSSNDFEESEEEEEAAETAVESEGGERRRRKTSRYHQVRRGRWVRTAARVVERVGLVGRRNWDAKRKRRVQKRRRKIGVPGGPDEGRREDGGGGHTRTV